MVNISTTKQSIANYAAGLGHWVGLSTANPGNTATVLNEASGGSPAYARQSTTWTSGGSGGVVNGSAVTINVPAGTFTYAVLCSASTGNYQVDWSQIIAMTTSAQSQIIVTPTYTVT
jgi:hypothetical protein